MGILAHGVAKEHHTTDDSQRTDCCHLAAADEVLEAELQADAEQHKQHADVAPCLDVFLIHPGPSKQIGAYQDAGNDIAQHYRLLQKLKNEADYRGSNHQNI